MTATTWSGWPAWVERESAAVRAAGRWRSVRDLDGPGPQAVLFEAGGDGAGRDRRVVSFASNDYLGLTRHPKVAEAAHRALDEWGTGSGSARLVAGSRPVHSELERDLAQWKGADRAALFPTGFAANLGVLSVVGGPGVRIFSDDLNHASIVDGCRLAAAQVTVYPHKDVAWLDQELSSAGQAVVVSDSVFSMDGDAAPVDDLVEVCRRHDALLVLDEAHAVLGPEPPSPPPGLAMLRVGTLSKTLASLGGFVAGPASLIDLVVNRARSYMFTTASSPADVAAALAALRVVRSSEGETLTARLSDRVDQLRPGHPTPIVPVVIGDEDDAVAASRALLQEGFLVPAIRPPTVPPGTSRLRISLSAAHSTEEVERLAAALSALSSLSSFSNDGK